MSHEHPSVSLTLKGLRYFLSGDCSGNGAAVAGMFRSRCACSGSWSGPCCRRRRPWRNWGDPHLETLDGEASFLWGDPDPDQ